MAGKRESIVLIDSHEQPRQQLEQDLTAAGYDVFGAESCAEGVEVALKSEPELVIIDAGEAGSCWSDTVARLKGSAATRYVRILVLSSLGPAERARALDLGADDVISRPWENQEFLARIRNQLRTRRAAQSMLDQVRIAEEGQQIARTAFDALAVTEKMTKDAFSLDRRLRIGLAGVLSGALIMGGIFYFFTRRVEKESTRAYHIIAQLEDSIAGQQQLLANASRLRQESKAKPSGIEEEMQQLRDQTDTLKTQLAASAGDSGNVAELRRELDETTGRLNRIEGESKVAQGIIHTFSRSVCLLHVSVAFRDKDSGSRVHYAGLNQKGQPIVDSDGKPVLSLEGRGPEVRVDFFGSAFLISSSGLMLTNRHVVEPWWRNDDLSSVAQEGMEALLADVECYCPDSPRPLRTSVARISDEADLATVQVALDDAKRLPLSLDPLAKGAVSGAPVILMGYPTGLDAILARTDDETVKKIVDGSGGNPSSIMTALASRKLIRPITTQGHLGDILSDKLVYDAQTTSGGSGGPLFNEEGKVIGVNYAILKGFSGSNFGIPIRFADSLLGH
ncbi:MAG TPA: trypsin-like peptidase domain-containing protein [Candidatus Acidoferrales bacterium]|nr:trypsin-like peptidase domain-containing protein [Candidatus Acidoferrales bacterium]